MRVPEPRLLIIRSFQFRSRIRLNSGPEHGFGLCRLADGLSFVPRLNHFKPKRVCCPNALWCSMLMLSQGGKQSNRPTNRGANVGRPELKQFGDLTPADFDRHPAWIACPTEDHGEPGFERAV